MSFVSRKIVFCSSQLLRTNSRCTNPVCFGQVSPKVVSQRQPPDGIFRHPLSHFSCPSGVVSSCSQHSGALSILSTISHSPNRLPRCSHPTWVLAPEHPPQTFRCIFYTSRYPRPDGIYTMTSSLLLSREGERRT